MRKFLGKSVLPQIAIGKVYVYNPDNPVVTAGVVENIEAELDRYDSVLETVAAELTELYETARLRVGEQDAAVFAMQALLLQDEEFAGEIRHRIEKGCNCAYAISQVAKEQIEVLTAIGDTYLAERAADIRDVATKMIRRFLGYGAHRVLLEEPVILFAEELTPSETMRFDTDKILAFVTRKGSLSSHAAILAKDLGIPALVEVDAEISADMDGIPAVVDGAKGEFLLDVSEGELEVYKQKKTELEKSREALSELIGLDNVTKSGKRINVNCNIGSLQDAEEALLQDCGGIGLFRSEFLFMGRDSLPDEEEQFECYKKLLTMMEGKNVVIRALDIGADKTPSYVTFEKELNPALGLRGIRLLLREKNIFMAQIKALLRASFFGKLSISFPMITSVSEVKQAKELIAEAKEILRQEGKDFGEAELGVMIETPAAVMIAEELAREVSFFSIGTNDLTQFTLAIDRQNSCLNDIYDSRHKAILRMIRMTVESAHEHGTRVCICGELANDYTLTESFIEMGVDELSVSPYGVLGLREKIRSLS